jgi:hypothetical protein
VVLAERFQAVTSCPAFLRFAAIPLPMVPIPKYAIFVIYDSFFLCHTAITNKNGSMTGNNE